MLHGTFSFYVYDLPFSEHVEYSAAAYCHAQGLTLRLFSHPQQQSIEENKEMDLLWDVLLTHRNSEEHCGTET